jgi:ABC-type molybdate transport system substrate-binding protein
MKNKALLTYLLIGGAAYYFIYKSKAKKKSYTITVPEPTKISEQEFRQKAPVKSIFEKAAPIVKKIFKKKKAVGNFPNTI